MLYLMLGIAAEAILGHPHKALRLRYLFANAQRFLRSRSIMRGKEKSPRRRELLELCLLLVPAMALPFLLCWPFPWMGVLFYYFALDIRTLCDRAMSVRRALDDGLLTQARAELTQLGGTQRSEEYDALVRDAVAGLMFSFARSVLGMLLVTWVGIPLKLGPAFAWGYAMLAQLSQGGNHHARTVYQRLYRLMLPVASLGIVVFGGLIGLSSRRAWRAFRKAPMHPGDVLLAALGYQEGPEVRSILVSGDITQACLMCWILTAAFSAVMFLIYALIGLL